MSALLAEAPRVLDAVTRWAKVDSAGQLALVVFGVLAQLLFFGRWVVQWVATERRGASYVPETFWWLSLAGAGLLLVYFVLRGEPVGVLGQSVGWLIYLRNLQLIRRRAAARPRPTDGSGAYDAPS